MDFHFGGLLYAGCTSSEWLPLLSKEWHTAIQEVMQNMNQNQAYKVRLPMHTNFSWSCTHYCLDGRMNDQT